MSLPDSLHFAARGQALQSILPNGFQHHQARFAPLLLDLLQQAFVDERGDSIEDLCRTVIAFKSRTNGLCRLQSAASDEDREPPEETLLLGAQQIITPPNGVTQRLVPYWRISCPARQGLQEVLQSP